MSRSRSKIFLFAGCVALCLVVSTQSVFGQEDRAIRIAKLAKASTVFIETDKGTGSGFVIAEEFVATNHHVIEEASTISVHLVGYKESLRASIFVDDKDDDLAVIKVPGLDAPSLALSRDRLPPQGSRVYVYGNPLNLEGTFSSGEISALRGNQFIQITAPISPGSSGGPVFDGRGYVIGVAKGQLLDKERRSQNLNVAIPIFYLTQLVRGRVTLAHDSPFGDDTQRTSQGTRSSDTSNSSKLVGIWDGEITETGYPTKIVWQVDADGTYVAWFSSIFGTTSRTGRWSYSNGILDQVTASGTVTWVNDNHIVITIIQNEDGPSSRGRTRHYYRRQ